MNTDDPAWVITKNGNVCGLSGFLFTKAGLLVPEQAHVKRKEFDNAHDPKLAIRRTRYFCSRHIWNGKDRGTLAQDWWLLQELNREGNFKIVRIR